MTLYYNGVIMYPDSSLAPSCRMPANGIETKPGHIMVFAWVGRLMLIFCAPAFFCGRIIFLEDKMYHLKTEAHFDSAHFLAGYNGKCANIHGHCWKIEAEISGSELQQDGEKRGMLIDFGDFKKAVRAAADSFDHTLIYEKGSLKDTTLAALKDEGFVLTEVNFRPTAENLSRHFYTILTAQGLPVSKVTVYETPENCAYYEGE